MAESTTSMNSHINLEAKLSGKPVAGKRHNGFDEAGVGNVSKGAGLRASAKALELPPYPKVNAPVLDPTDGARPRTWHPDNLRGRQFVQFVSLGYHCFLSKKIKEMRAELG